MDVSVEIQVLKKRVDTKVEKYFVHVFPPGMAFPTFLLFSVATHLFFGAAQRVINTPNASGAGVVAAVVQKIQASNIFPDDKKFLCRVAWVESKYGTDPNTYRRGYHGGIWQVDIENCRKTHLMYSEYLFTLPPPHSLN